MTATKTTRRSTPKLSEVARHLVIPEGITMSVFPRVRRRLAEAGVYFDTWQDGFGTVALGCREDGIYAATIGGVVGSIPRQVGKTFTVGNLLIGLALEFPGLKAAWTSHHNRTTTNTFRSMQGMVRRKSIAPLLLPNRSQGIRTANGEQEIAFANGSIILFGAREHGFGRGLDEIDVLVFDEAQILGLKALEDMVPATNQARHKHGALIFFLGTPPRPGIDDGEAFTHKREQALSGRSTDMVYVEFSAEPGTDPDDRDQWPLMNPSYPHRTPLEAMLRMRENIPDDDSWNREARGIWPPSGGGLISPGMWSALTDPASAPTDPVSFGLYINREQTAAAIGVAGYRPDGLYHVGVVPAQRGADVSTLPGTAWVADRMKELVDTWEPCAVVVDERSAAGSLVADLEKLGITVTKTTATAMAQACGKFYAAVRDQELRHRGAAPLQQSVCAGKRRDLADAWAWDRKDPSSDITQLVAVTLALHGLIVHGQPQETEVWGFFA